MIDFSLIFASYIIGSFSSAVIICKMMGIPDPRYNGSNNPGATNVKRLGGNKAAAFVLFGDSIKGLLPVLGSAWLGVSEIILACVGMAVFLGHLYPIFFKFVGGKGVATSIGILFGLNVLVGFLVATIWLLVAKITKISSLSAIVSLIFSPAIIYFIQPSVELITMQIAITSILLWRHRKNISNLISGKEAKMKN
tara:strand:- start:15539 stop:16123 length:585 start_codon:yes stop_codon:yes gene_type:complete